MQKSKTTHWPFALFLYLLTSNGQWLCAPLQLFLMKRGGEEIYVGPLGRHSCELIKYFEVNKSKLTILFFHQFMVLH